MDEDQLFSASENDIKSTDQSIIEPSTDSIEPKEYNNNNLATSGDFQLIEVKKEEESIDIDKVMERIDSGTKTEENPCTISNVSLSDNYTSGSASTLDIRASEGLFSFTPMPNSSSLLQSKTPRRSVRWADQLNEDEIELQVGLCNQETKKPSDNIKNNRKLVEVFQVPYTETRCHRFCRKNKLCVLFGATVTIVIIIIGILIGYLAVISSTDSNQGNTESSFG